MMFRKYGGSSLSLVERYISNPNRCFSSSSAVFYFLNPKTCILKAHNHNYCNYHGFKTRMTPPVRLRRTRPGLGKADYTYNISPWFLVQERSFLTIPGSGAKRKDYSERRIMGFSREQMYDVVADVGQYQKFLPWCQKSLVKARRKDHIIADLEVGFPPLVESYTSSVTLHKPHVIRAESTQGKLFNQLITTWKFGPGLKGKPQTCVVDFYVSFEFRSAVTSQLANVFFNEVVRAMAGAFYEEAKVRYGAESVPSRKINIVPVGGDGRDKE